MSTPIFEFNNDHSECIYDGEKFHVSYDKEKQTSYIYQFTDTDTEDSRRYIIEEKKQIQDRMSIDAEYFDFRKCIFIDNADFRGRCI